MWCKQRRGEELYTFCRPGQMTCESDELGLWVCEKSYASNTLSMALFSSDLTRYMVSPELIKINAERKKKWYLSYTYISPSGKLPAAASSRCDFGSKKAMLLCFERKVVVDINDPSRHEFKARYG